jgi:hypothetical protein
MPFSCKDFFSVTMWQTLAARVGGEVSDALPTTSARGDP